MYKESRGLHGVCSASVHSYHMYNTHPAAAEPGGGGGGGMYPTPPPQLFWPELLFIIKTSYNQLISDYPINT